MIGPGPIGLMGVGVAKALGAQPVILTGTRDRRLEMGKRLGADAGRQRQPRGPGRRGRSGSPAARACNTCSNARARRMRSTRRRGWSTAAAASASPRFPREPVPVDLAYLVRNNIYVFGIRGEGKSATHRAAALMAQKRFDAKTDPHPHLPARRGADRDPIRPRAHRRRDQGRRSNSRKLNRNGTCAHGRAVYSRGTDIQLTVGRQLTIRQCGRGDGNLLGY